MTLSSVQARDQLEEFTLFRLISLFPIDEFHQSPSWNFSVTSRRIYDQHCIGCYAGGLEGGVGAALSNSLNQFYAFVFFNSSFFYSKEFIESPYLWNVGPQIGFLYHFNKFHIKLLAESNWSLDKLNWGKSLNKSIDTQEIELRHNVTENWSWGVTAKNFADQQSFEFGLYRFF
jgi:hypothetical protein